MMPDIKKKDGVVARSYQNSTESPLAARLRVVVNLMSRNQREFAEQVGMPYRTLQDYLAGRSKPGADHLARMAERGVDVYWLLTGRTRLPLFGETGEIGKPNAGYVLANTALVKGLWQKGIEKTDGYAIRHHLLSSRLLSAEDVIDVTLYYYGLMLKIALNMSDNIAKLIELGASQATIISVISDPITEEFDSGVREYLATKSTPQAE